LLQGKSGKEMALTLNLSARTVESYLENMKIKLVCRNKADLIIKLSVMIA
jgi:DNA-binding CsgD family transcriptional regulator